LQFIALVLVDIELPVFSGGWIIQAKEVNQPGGEKARRQMSQGVNRPRWGEKSARGERARGQMIQGVKRRRGKKPDTVSGIRCLPRIWLM